MFCLKDLPGSRHPLKTVQDWISKVEVGKNIQMIQPRRGQKPKVSQSTKKKIARTAKQKPSSSCTGIYKLAGTQHVEH